ncbi:MAG: hypothetical protein QG604_534 [Candidatus Dependentiae bacterium]|nr:hypothetical protein [Candidatus Dependentiae bacterium]
MARSYDISLLPSLQEQAAFFKQQSLELVKFCEDEYGRFLALIDAQSDKTEDAETIEDLQEIYAFAASRLEALQEMMQQEVDAIEDWQKMLDRVALTGDTALWADVAEEMITEGDFKADAHEFKAWATEEMVSLKRGVNEVLVDWQSAIEEGNIADLAKFIEAIDEMEEEEAEGNCCLDDECSDEECGDDSDECCGKQDPCCRTEDEQDEE